MFKSEESNVELETNIRSPIKIGLIGMGNIGRVHYEALKRFPQANFEVVVVDPKPSHRSKT